jgi:hypothetical protein
MLLIKELTFSSLRVFEAIERPIAFTDLRLRFQAEFNALPCKSNFKLIASFCSQKRYLVFPTFQFNLQLSFCLLFKTLMFKAGTTSLCVRRDFLPLFVASMFAKRSPNQLIMATRANVGGVGSSIV